VHEGLQVALERAGVGRGAEPLLQLDRVGGGQLVAAARRQLDDRGRPQPAVEVVVQQRLGSQSQVGIDASHRHGE
jgi:hypothetical protein